MCTWYPAMLRRGDPPRTAAQEARILELTEVLRERDHAWPVLYACASYHEATLAKVWEVIAERKEDILQVLATSMAVEGVHGDIGGWRISEAEAGAAISWIESRLA